MAASQTFNQTTQKNSDIPTLDEALANNTGTISAQHRCRRGLPTTATATVVVNPYRQVQPMRYLVL